MPDAHPSDSDATRVMALYPDGWHAFALAGGATLGELAGMLEHLEGAYEGAVIDVRVKFGMKSTQQTIRALHTTELGRDTHEASKERLH